MRSNAQWELTVCTGPWEAVGAETKAYGETNHIGGVGVGAQLTQVEISLYQTRYEAIRDFEQRTHVTILGGLIRQWRQEGWEWEAEVPVRMMFQQLKQELIEGLTFYKGKGYMIMRKSERS